jgi:protein translocase SecG subunit
MGTILLTALQVLCAVALIALIMMQTTKSEQSGGSAGMGWGTIGGKSSSSFHTKWGLEAHLDRITTYVAISFFVISLVTAYVRLGVR